MGPKERYFEYKNTMRDFREVRGHFILRERKLVTLEETRTNCHFKSKCVCASVCERERERESEKRTETEKY